MSVKNIMEDVVSSTVKEVLKNPEIISLLSNHPDEYQNDITAFVLNRIPAKYVTSERGFLHGKLDAKYVFQQKTDILLLIHEAISVINTRRKTFSENYDPDILNKTDLFPHILGQVLEETSFSVIPDVEVIISTNGKPAKMIDKTWFNPYLTSTGSKGYYHFWPEYNAEETPEKIVTFSLEFNHPKFIKRKIEIDVPVINDFDFNKSKLAPLVLMELKPGENISFLYE